MAENGKKFTIGGDNFKAVLGMLCVNGLQVSAGFKVPDAGGEIFRKLVFKTHQNGSRNHLGELGTGPLMISPGAKFFEK